MSLLKPGEILHSHSTNQAVRVEALLGGGGQGEVYRGAIEGRPVAIKWYFSSWLEIDPGLETRLEYLVGMRPPGNVFLWPEQLVYKGSTPGFGYITELRDDRFKELLDLLSGRESASVAVIARAGFELATGLHLLHAQGLCYQDISFNTVLFDPDNGSIRLRDFDNIGINGNPSSSLGTPKFLAPEIIQRQKSPSIQTDLHSLAVLLFYMFHLHHPLEGKRMLQIRDDTSEKVQDLLYGSGALFIFDPENRENEAVNRTVDPTGLSGHNALLNWALYPPQLREQFTKTFTIGLRDAFKRVTASQWRSTMVALLDSIYSCPCGEERYLVPRTSRGTTTGVACPNCGVNTALPPRMRITRTADQSMIAVTPKRRLFAHHIDSKRPFDLSAVVGEVILHPSQPGLLGLKNLTNEQWSAYEASGRAVIIEPGQTIPLIPNLKIQFGDSDAEIRS